MESSSLSYPIIMVIPVAVKKMVEMFLLLFYCGFSALATLKYSKIKFQETSLNILVLYHKFGIKSEFMI